MLTPTRAHDAGPAGDVTEKIRVLAADDSEVMLRILGVLIASQDDMLLVGTAKNGHDAVRLASELQPNVVLMDLNMPDLDGIQATWLVFNKVPHGGVIIVTSEDGVENIQRAMAAGAQGYIVKPFGDGAALLQTIRDVHARVQARRMQLVHDQDGAASTQSRSGRGKRLVVVGTKGGLGRTTVAVSLALGLRKQTQASVVLVDADFLFGDADLHLDLTSERSILDLVPHMGYLDRQLIEQVVAKHSSGVHVLARPPRPEQAEAITDDHVRAVLACLGQIYDWVILDTSPSYDDRMLAMLDMADVYTIVLTPHVGALRNTRHFLDVARKLGFPEDRMCFVLNRANSGVDISLDGVASVVGTRRILQLPSSGAQPTQAVNRGRPLLMERSSTALSKALLTLVEHVRVLALS